MGGGYWGYTWYRLRLFCASKGIGIILHFLELFLFFNQLQQTVFIKLALLRLIIGLCEAAWWGFLEGLRDGVRGDLEFFRQTRCQLRIASWFSWSVVAGAISLLVAFSILGWGLISGAGGELLFSILYIFAYLFRFAGSVISRTVHGAVYGYSRVYRPLWSIVIADIIWLAALISLWPLIGLYAIVVGTILSSAATAFLSIYFALPLYKRLNFSPPAFNRRSLFNKLGPRLTDCRSAIASLAMRVGSMLLLGFFNSDNSGIFSLLWMVYFIVNIPLLDIAASWCNLFYFDFKKYNHPAFAAVYPRLGKFVNWVSYELGLLVWVISYLIGGIFLGDDMFDLLLGSAIYFILRSRLGAVQIRAFCENRYWQLVVSTLFLALGMAVINNVSMTNMTRVLYFGLLIVSVIVLLELGSTHLKSDNGKACEILPYEFWQKKLTHAKAVASGPLTVRKLLFSKNCKELPLFLMRLAERLPPTAAITLWSDSMALYFDAAADNPHLGQELLFRISQGQLYKIREYHIVPVLSDPVAPYPWEKGLYSFINNRDSLITYIHSNYPQAIWIDLFELDKNIIVKMDSYVRRALLKAAHRSISYCRPVSVGFHKILAVTEAGTIRYIILVPIDNKNLTSLVKHLLHFSFSQKN